MQLNLEEIRAIAKMANEKGLDQVVVESTDADSPVCRLQLRKLQQCLAPAVVAENDVLSMDAPSAPEAHTLIVTSPTVGIFRFGNIPLVKGQLVKEQQVVGLVESLKVPNEVRLSAGGMIESVFVEDGQGVEFGQPLIAVNIDS